MSLKISRILHAGYVFECDGAQIAFDPIFENPFSRNCHAFPDVRFNHEQIEKLNLSAVFISHYHDDHCSLESLNFLDRKTPIYLYCLFEELFDWIRELGFVNVHRLNLNVPVQVGSMEVTARRALDADVDSIFHIQAEGLNVLNVVDSWIDPETLGLHLKDLKWDMVLWPFQTMRELEVLSPSRAAPAPKELPPEWIEQLKILNPRIVVPSSCQFQQESWSWYNHAFFPVTYRAFQEQVQRALPQAQIVRMNPSVSILLGKNSWETATPLSWVLPVGDQNVDYVYEPRLKPPSTAEIARHFSSLTKGQTESVLDYCQLGLLQKFNSLEPSEDPYFQNLRIWKLSLYDHQGDAIQFWYRLKRGRIEPTHENDGPLSWSTEVPISKLLAALESGESLTSMYMRINDDRFDPEIEQEIHAVDITEDPLVRSLFARTFGAYQLAQLEHLRNSGFSIRK